MNYEYWKAQFPGLATLCDASKVVAAARVDLRNAVAARLELYESGLKPKFQQAKAAVASLRTRRSPE